LSSRVRLALVASSVLLISAVLAGPEVSQAKPPAAVKQYESTITPTSVSGSSTGVPFQVIIRDCGTAPYPTGSRCTAQSTIQLGTAQILVPSRFTINGSSVSASSSNHNWAASWDGTYIQAYAVTGNDKLNGGDSVTISFTADVPGCSTTGSPYQFTTTAWGSTPTHTGETFTPLAQPSVSVNGCALQSGDPVGVTGEGGTNVTGDGYTGTVDVSFGGTLTCNDDPSGKWQQGYHLPDVVNIDPSGVTSTTEKSFTFRFSGDADSSFYVICYTPSELASTTTGFILPPCYPGGGAALINPPCVDQQYRDIATNKVTIKIRVPAGDPRAH
jgi:hypothetical protein